jgi:hypothetical protein
MLQQNFVSIYRSVSNHKVLSVALLIAGADDFVSLSMVGALSPYVSAAAKKVVKERSCK